MKKAEKQAQKAATAVAQVSAAPKPGVTPVGYRPDVFNPEPHWYAWNATVLHHKSATPTPTAKAAPVAMIPEAPAAAGPKDEEFEGLGAL